MIALLLVSLLSRIKELDQPIDVAHRLLVFGVPQGEPRAVRQSRLGSP
jgi:hypothetical protein